MRASRRRRQQADGDGLPDPAAGLDRLELWIERRLPLPPRPLWAEGLVVVLRLLLGRGSWIVGTLFVALGAPWFVLVHRQVDTMVRAAWYRATATATAEARVERVELRLVSGVWDGTQRVVPSVLLSFDPRGMEAPATPATGSAERIWVRYLPHGEGLEAHHQWGSSPPLLASPPPITPSWRFRWTAADAPSPGFDLLWSESAATLLESAAPWNGETFLANALADLDRPIDLLVGDWTRSAEEATCCRCASDPAIRIESSSPTPSRTFRRRPATASPSFLFSLILMIPFGLPFWWVGTRLISRGVAPRHRHYFVWVPLALLPFWGGRYLEIIERLSPGAFERNALLTKVGSTQVLPGAERTGPGQARDSRRRVDFSARASPRRWRWWISPAPRNQRRTATRSGASSKRVSPPHSPDSTTTPSAAP